MSFVHLHVHSHYSLLDGLTRIDELVKAAKADGQPALALTDHGVMYGAIEFYRAAKKAGVKPIIGIEAYLAPRSRTDREKQADERAYSHLILLAKNRVGYQNLLQLTTKSHLEGFYYKPRIDWELLEQCGDGLIALSGCMGGEIPRLIRDGKDTDVEAAVKRYRDRFGSDFYLELQHRNDIPELRTINARLLALSQRHHIPIVATNDVHYLHADDAEAQDVLLCLQTKSKQEDTDRLSMRGENYSFRTAKDMALLFEDHPEAIANTLRIADACTLDLELDKIQLPAYELPKGETNESYLKTLCLKGLERRYDRSRVASARERLDYELATVEKMGLSSYFLIVQDFVNWAKGQGIVVGPGRGSAAGSIVSYLLNITNLDPLAYNLLFERFLAPGRIQMPDIDIDFADHRRDEVIQYVKRRYGEDRVAQIITFGTMAARASIRDVGRVLDVPYAFCDRLAKLIPLHASLDEAVRDVDELRELSEADDTTRNLLAIAKRLEGAARHTSTHACGVVITAEPLVASVPLQRASADDATIITQYEMHAVEVLGLLKMDFLGLSNLSIIEHAVNIIRARGTAIDIDALPLDDADAYALLQAGETTGVFQLESGGMKRYLKELKPSQFEDIIAMVALYRPGPMELIPEYIDRKFGRKPIAYLHPKLETVLKNTYGIMVYQEQLMHLARELAGFSMAQADTLRKAVGKKIKSLLDEQRTKLIEGMIGNKIPEKTAKKIWEWIEPFARYGFNRCVTGDTEICDPRTGRLVTIGVLAHREVRGGDVFALGADQRIARRPMVHAWSNGKRPVHRIRTRSGRVLRATGNHPLRAFSGWRNLDELQVGDRIGVPRTVPLALPDRGVPPHALTVLGYVLAEGNLCHPHGFYHYAKDEREVQDYVAALEQFENTRATIDRTKSATSVYAARRDVRQPSAAVEWLRSLDCYGRKATQKVIPEIVFELSSDELAVVIAKMFQGDGSITYQNGAPSVFYATSSERLAHQFQHLLLRFGILSVIHRKQFRYRGGLRPGYTIAITRFDNLEKFVAVFSGHFVGQKHTAARRIVATHPVLTGTIPRHAARGSMDIIPVEVLQEVRAAMAVRAWGPTELSRHSGAASRLFHADERRVGYLRETLERVANVLESDALRSHAQSDIFWDEIVEIVPDGIEETYDLSVDGDHNFIANDIFVHNSHAACYALIAYQTAYLKAHFPAEFMAALLTSERGDTERLSVLIQECREMKMTVRGPDINESDVLFTVVDRADSRQPTVASVGGKCLRHPGLGACSCQLSAIRFGLAAIKNVGEHLVEMLVAERKMRGPYQSIEDLCERTRDKDFNKKSLECIIKSGCLDRFGERGQLLAAVETILTYHRAIAHEAEIGQESLFQSSGKRSPLVIPPSEPAAQRMRLAWEKELLGLYLSAHPFETTAKAMGSAVVSVAALKQQSGEQQVIVGGVITRMKRIVTKKGDGMLFAEIEDHTGNIEVVVFPRVLTATAAAWMSETIVLARGKRSDRDGEVKILADHVVQVVPGREAEALRSVGGSAQQDSSPSRRSRDDSREGGGASGGDERSSQQCIVLQLPASLPPERLRDLRSLLERYPGAVSVRLRSAEGRLVSTGARVAWAPELRTGVEGLLGAGAVLERQGVEVVS